MVKLEIYEDKSIRLDDKFGGSVELNPEELVGIIKGLRILSKLFSEAPSEAPEDKEK